MSFNIINKNYWNRINTYNEFYKISPCTYSMTVNLDITRLYKTITDNHLQLFPTVLYGITEIVNLIKEFRFDIDSNGNVGFYDSSNPCYTLFHNDTETFTNVWTPYSSDYSVFIRNYLCDTEAYSKDSEKSKPIEDSNIFYVSCIPWTSFTGFNLNLQNGYKCFSPIFTIGRFYLDNGKVLLPFAVQVHHAVCDGFHTSKFINELQQWANQFSL